MENVRNNKNIKRKYLQFFFSMLVSVLILQITTIIDSIIVGTCIGTKEMSGVKASNPIISIVAVIATLISVGTSMVISISLGKRNIKKSDTAFTFGFIICLLVGASLSLIGWLLSDKIVAFFTSSEDVLEFAKTYTKIVILASPALMLSTYLGYAIRSDGFAKLSMVLLIAGGVINVSFDLIFILGAKIGVAGAAIATDMSYIGSTIIAVIYLFMKNRNLHFVNIFKRDSGIKEIFIGIIKNGAPSSARLLFVSISTIIANYVIGKYVGYMGLAVFAVASNLSLIATAVFQSSGASMMPIMGVFYGEKDYKGIELLVRYVMFFLLGLVAFIILLIEAFAPLYFPLFGIANPLPEYVTFLRLFSLGLVFAGINYILIYYFTALQKMTVGVLIPLLEQIILCIPLTFILISNYQLNGLIWVYLISEGGTTLITFIILYFIKKKKKAGNILLLPKANNEVLLDFTVLASNIEATKISEDVGKILLENKVDGFRSNRVAVILEEMIVNTKNAEKHNKKVFIDVRIIKTNESIIVSMRSNGYPYNPLIESDDDISQKLISSLSIKLRYNQIIGFNQTLIEV